MTALAPTVEAFFTQRLAVQCDASPHTVAAYRDTLRLCWSSPATAPTHRPPGSTSATSTPRWSRRSSTHLQTERANSVSTRNARLTAIHSLFRHSALRHPEHAESIQRVLAIPAKRHQQKLVCFLTRDQIDALLAAPDNGTWSVAVITPCSRWPSKPACGSPN